MAIKISRKMRKMMEAADNLLHGRIAVAEEQIEENDDRLDTLTASEAIEGSIAQAFSKLRGSVGDEVDTLEEIVSHINVLETSLMDIIRADRVNNKVIYMPKSGDITDMEIGTFIHNLGIATTAGVNEALIKLKDSVTKDIITLDENSNYTLPIPLKISSIVDVLLVLADGREIPIIHFDIIDGTTFTAYNAFEGDLANRELHLHYLDFGNIQI